MTQQETQEQELREKIKNGESVEWNYISWFQQLSEPFIREFKDNVNWNCISRNQHLSENFIRELKNKVNWPWISACQQLSEELIREFKDNVEWEWISHNQKLSEPFIREFKDKVNWYNISMRQQLYEDFIREFKDNVNWPWISINQQLSETFIREFKDNVYWPWISACQQLSEPFIREFKDNINIKVHNEIWELKSTEQKRKEIKKYAKQHKLKFEDDVLYAFREHDHFGRGEYNKTISYHPGTYYKDWHCDMRQTEGNSFGLGIWPKGNTPIKVKTEDWGVAVNREDGKARVWGFEIVK